MLAEYESDIEEINQGDEYGNNIVDLYNPMDYVTKKANETDHPVWMKMIMGAQEGDISLFNSMNLALALSAQGVNVDLDWQWNGGHVPSEIFGDSFSLTVDTMYGEYVSGAVKINKSKDKVSQNGEAEQAEGENISSWVQTSNSDVTVNTKELINYRTKNAMKAVPGFDVIDYGQEDYVFGSSDKDARHWDETVLEILKENQDELSSLFNQNNN